MLECQQDYSHFKCSDNPNDLILKNQGSNANRFQLPNVFIDICSYRNDLNGDSRSNALAATLNAFESDRVKWIKQQTGNFSGIAFGGKYFSEPTIRLPEIHDEASNQEILKSRSTSLAVGGNSISVYDLTRFMSLIGWHLMLPPSKRLPNISQQGLDLAIIAMGTDTARYVDTAFSTLGLENAIDSPIVISKLGFGPSEKRNETDLVYTAFVQFTDQHSDPTLRSFALTLRANTKGQGSDGAINLDTDMAAAVTEIIRRIVTDDFE
jgi:hypothetical protein